VYRQVDIKVHIKMIYSFASVPKLHKHILINYPRNCISSAINIQEMTRSKLDENSPIGHNNRRKETPTVQDDADPAGDDAHPHSYFGTAYVDDLV
jgi:hypothetical protein